MKRIVQVTLLVVSLAMAAASPPRTKRPPAPTGVRPASRCASAAASPAGR